MRLRERLFRQAPAALGIVFAIPFVVTGMQYDPTTRGMPVTVAAVTIALCILDIIAQEPGRLGAAVRRFFSGSAEMPATDLHPSVTPLRELGAFAWVVAFVAITVFFGFYIAIPIYIFGYLRFYANRGLVISLVAALGVVAFIYVLFQLTLGYELFRGILFGDFA